MTYSLSKLTFRTDNSPTGVQAITEVWQDIANGRLPLLTDNQYNILTGITLVAQYSNYADNERGSYDLSIMQVNLDFFQQLEQQVSQGLYAKYEASDPAGNLESCTRQAWSTVWKDQEVGTLTRAFTYDYESILPAEQAEDNQAHCYLYIAIC